MLLLDYSTGSLAILLFRKDKPTEPRHIGSSTTVANMAGRVQDRSPVRRVVAHRGKDRVVVCRLSRPWTPSLASSTTSERTLWTGKTRRLADGLQYSCGMAMLDCSAEPHVLPAKRHFLESRRANSNSCPAHDECAASGR